MTSLLAPLLLLAVSGAPQVSVESPPDSDPFAGFETLFLDNGLKVWYKRMADDPVVAISVALPFGADADALLYSITVEKLSGSS